MGTNDVKRKDGTGDVVLAIDQGTTGSTALLISLAGQVLARHNQEFPQHYPRPGEVEHEPDEIWASVLASVDGALSQVPGARDRIAAIGITNQRETILVWDPETGRTVGRAIVWQDRRTAAHCAALKAQGNDRRVREVTGLVIDPYFSATKLDWLLRQDAAVKKRGEAGELQFGTIDSYLLYRLGGRDAAFIMEVTNASRTLLMDLRKREFSPEMCELFGVPARMLPRIVPSAGVAARTRGVPGLPDGIPISGIAGDQHAALFGQACIGVGDAKCTYGTGAFVLVNTGDEPLQSEAGLLSTLGWQIGDHVTYALEGSCFIAGAAVQWLRDGLGLIDSSAAIEALARSVPSSEGVVFVPALAGLGAPHWDPDARGLITGLTRGTTRAHLARATLEAIALSVDDLLRSMEEDLRRAGRPGLTRLRVDGGASENNLLMELQAGISGIAVDRPTSVESTARGAALLAALGAELLPGQEAAAGAFELDRRFGSAWTESQRNDLRDSWLTAISRARSAVAPV